MAGYWPRTRPISSHLDRTNLVNKEFIIWLSGKCFLQDTAGSPERARWLGSQSHFAIWFILPVCRTSHIIKGITVTAQLKLQTTQLQCNSKQCNSIYKYVNDGSME